MKKRTEEYKRKMLTVTDEQKQALADFRKRHSAPRMKVSLTSRLTGYMEEWDTLMERVEDWEDEGEGLEPSPEDYQRLNWLSGTIAALVCADYQIHKIRRERGEEPGEEDPSAPTTAPTEEQLDWVEVNHG